MKQYAVYFVTNWTHEILYIGVTNHLERRSWQHQAGSLKGFSQKYKTCKLVYYELFGSIELAILREKQLKKWRREKKDFLVNQMNPDWRDLSQDWNTADPSASLGMTEKKTA